MYTFHSGEDSTRQSNHSNHTRITVVSATGGDDAHRVSAGSGTSRRSRASQPRTPSQGAYEPPHYPMPNPMPMPMARSVSDETGALKSRRSSEPPSFATFQKFIILRFVKGLWLL